MGNCLKAGFHKRRSRSRSRSSNQKRRAHDLVKTAFRLRLRLRRLRSTYDLVKTRLSESKGEVEEPNQSQSVGTCIVIGLSFRFCFWLRQSQWFSLDHKRDLSDRVVSGVGKNGNVLILLIPSCSWLCLRLRFLISLGHKRSYDSGYDSDSDSDSVASENQPRDRVKE